MMKKIFVGCLMVAGSLFVRAAIPSPTYVLPFDTALEQSEGSATFAFTGGQFDTLGTNYDLVSSPLGRAILGWGNGPSGYLTYTVLRIGTAGWTLNVRLKVAPREDEVILSLGDFTSTTNPGFLLTSCTNGVTLKMVTKGPTVQSSLRIELENATTAYHNYTFVFSYLRTQSTIVVYADGVLKGTLLLAEKVIPKFQGSGRGFRLFGSVDGLAETLSSGDGAAAAVSSIEDIRFWRDKKFTAEQVAELNAQYTVSPPTDTPFYHWTFDAALNDQADATDTLDFSNAMSATLADGAIEGKGEGPYWLDTFNLSGSWTWLMRLKTVDAEKACVCSLGWCSRSGATDCGLLVVTDGAKGIRLLNVTDKNTCLGSLAVSVADATAAFHDYALTYLAGTDAVAVFVDGVYQGELPIATGLFTATATVQLFGQCGGIGACCTYETPGPQIADLKFYRHDGRTLTWNGTKQVMPNIRFTAANANWLAANGDATFFSAGSALNFTDAAGQTDVRVMDTLTTGAVTIDNSAQDYTFTGAYALNGTGVFTKRGTGRVTWGSVALPQRASINIEAGVFQLDTTEANLFGTSGDVVVSDGAQFDLHTTGAENADSPVLAKTFHLAGAGADGTGALVNTGNGTAGAHLGAVVLDADATIGGTSRIDFRTSGKGVTGEGKTLTIANTNGVTLAGGTFAVDAIRIPAGGLLQCESGVVQAREIALAGGTLHLNGTHLPDFTGQVVYGSGALKFTAMADAASPMAGAPWQLVVEPEADFTLPVTVAAGANPAALAPIAARKIDAQGTFTLAVSVGARISAGRWRLTESGDYTADDLAHWRVTFDEEKQHGLLQLANGNITLAFTDGGALVVVR